MKRSIIGFCLGIAVMGLLAMQTNYTVKKSTAEVENKEGLLIFTDSKPVQEYEYLGTVKSNTGGFGSSQYSDVRSRLIKNAKKEYPNAEGLLIQLNTGSADKADVIKFK